MNWLMNTKKIAIPILIAFLLTTCIARDPIFVMDVSNHGASGSKYASNSEYDVTGNNYSKTGQLTSTGMKQMQDSGKDFRREYIDQLKFMPAKFDPDTVYYHSIVDQSSLISAYSFNLGAYPDSVSFLEFTDGLSGQDHAKTHETTARKTLGLSERPPTGASTIPIKTEEGFMYWRDPGAQCPGVNKKVESNLYNAQNTLDGKYRSLYSQLASKFNKSPNKFKFDTTHLYLDDYEKAQQAGASYPKFPNQQAINKLIDEYEKDYYYQGVLGGNHISRVISSPLLNYLIVTAFAKSESNQGKLNDYKFKKLKYSHFFADEVPFASLLKVLGIPESHAPKAAELLRFELFTSGGKYFIRCTLDGQTVNLPGAQKGIVDLDSFFRTVYPQLYFGSIDNVCNQKEEITQYLQPECPDYRDYLSSIHDEISHIKHTATPRCRKAERVVEVQVPHLETIEVPRMVAVQPPPRVVVAPPPPPPRQQVIHEQRIIEKQVPVIEEKIVVHEVDKYVQEPPTTIHHLRLSVPEQAAKLPIQFAEQIDKNPDSGFPWWLLLLPFLCCIPLIAWYLCKKKQEPEVKAKQPMAPVAAKRLSKPEVKPEVKPEEKSPEKRYVIGKKVVDEGEEIEKEIERELVKTKAQKETRRSQQDLPVSAEPQFEASHARGSGGGRKRRIKTIKKFGQVIGREEQILDEFGNVISTKKIGIDDKELADEINHGNYVGSDAREVYRSNSSGYERRGSGYERRSSGGGKKYYIDDEAGI